MLERIADGLWQPWLLGLFLLTGISCTLRGGFFQFSFAAWLRASVFSLFRRRKGGEKGGLTQFQALATALASTIGTGSIAGVATAIFFGGPGAVFWMWASALVGLMTSFVEKTLTVKYRRRARGGGWEGGPMEYMERRLGWRLGARWFSLWCVLASLTGGALVQSNSISAALHAGFGWDRMAVGAAVAACSGAVIWGGIGRVGKVSERLVPAMAILFLTTGVAVIAAHREMVLPALGQIVGGALSPRAAAGGGLGYGVSAALRYGVARGVFTNEAGVGSSAMAHAAADAESPAQEGCWGMFEVFFATLVVCSVTALAILTSGVYDPADALTAIRDGTVAGEMTGAPLAGAAFASLFGRWGQVIVAVCLLLFAFTSLLGWDYYGERGLVCLTGDESLRRPFRLVFLAAVALGSVGQVGQVWALSDICNGLMALPNLLAILALAPEAVRELDGLRRGGPPSGGTAPGPGQGAARPRKNRRP